MACNPQITVLQKDFEGKHEHVLLMWKIKRVNFFYTKLVDVCRIIRWMPKGFGLTHSLFFFRDHHQCQKRFSYCCHLFDNLIRALSCLHSHFQQLFYLNFQLLQIRSLGFSFFPFHTCFLFLHYKWDPIKILFVFVIP